MSAVAVRCGTAQRDKGRYRSVVAVRCDAAHRDKVRCDCEVLYRPNRQGRAPIGQLWR